MSPSNNISSPEIGVEPGIYRYKITLDNNFTFEQEVRVCYRAGSSEKLHIDLMDNPDYPIVIGMYLPEEV